MRNLPLVLALCVSSALSAFAQSNTNVSFEDPDKEITAGSRGVYWAQDAEAQSELTAPSTTTAPLMMSAHGGSILTNVHATAIFWGTSWASYNGDVIAGMDSWYQGFGGSHYAQASDEYGASNGRVSSQLAYDGHYIDTTPVNYGGKMKNILTEVCKMIKNPDPGGNGFYPVYTDLPRGSAKYCAWHTKGSCNGVIVQYAFFFNLDGDGFCNPSDKSGLHSEWLAALANATGHELSEARTDPALNAWYDSKGYENGDKCAWSFGVPLVTFSNGTEWKIQGLWSNNAYHAGTGYPNRQGQKGCLSGE